MVCPNCTGPKSEYSVMATAGAGAPCRTGGYVKLFYDSEELLPDGITAGDAYAARTGRKTPPGSVVMPAIGQAIRDSVRLNGRAVTLGGLGEALHAAGVPTAVFGNADIPPDVVDRLAAVLAMDSRGIVYSGQVARPRIVTPSVGDGSFADSVRSRNGLSVIYFGASTRLDEIKPALADRAYASHKIETLRQLDSMLHTLLAEAHAGTTTLIVVSFAPSKSPSWDQLTPMVIYPAPSPALLRSATTRTTGLVAASDFAPTVLSLLGVAIPDAMAGSAARIEPDSQTIPRLVDLSARVTADHRLLAPAALAAAAIAAFSFTASALLVALRKRPRRLLAACKAGMVTVACYPAAMLLAVLAPTGMVGYIGGALGALVVLVLACVAAGARFRTGVRARPIVTAYALTCLVILVDAATGCNLCMFSALSSYQITGMRFYGIGNEYAALLISMAALAVLFATQGSKPRFRTASLAAVVGAAVVLALGLGNLGANYGATAAAVVTFGLMWTAVRRGGFGARHVAVAFVAAIAAVVMFALLDWRLAGEVGSHAARATGLAGKLGGGYLASIAVRKVAYNLYTTFSVKGISTMLAFVPFAALWFWGVRDEVRRMIGNRERKTGEKRAAEVPSAPSFLPGDGASQESHTSSSRNTETVMAGVKAVLIGAVAAFLLNDSGIVFAATMIGMTVLVLLYSVVEEAVPPARLSWQCGDTEGER